MSTDMKRYAEIDEDGNIVHIPDPSTTFVNTPPPTEVVFCDCKGVGVNCHHVYASGHHAGVSGAHVHHGKHRDSWSKEHTGPRCRHRRQFFVDITDRPEVQMGMKYNAKTKTFSAAK